MAGFKAAVLLAIVLAASGCGSRDGNMLTDNDREAIRAAAKQYLDADAKRDADGMMQVVAESAVYMPPASQPLVGREAIRALFKQHPWDKLAETQAEIEGRSDFAIVRGSWSAMLQGMPISGFYLEAWQKQADGAWKVTRKAWNTDRQ